MGNNQEEEWPIPLIKNWQTLDDKTVALFITQGETALKESIDTAKGISEKGYKYLTVVIPVISAIIYYLINSAIKKTEEPNEILIWTCLVGLAISLFSLYFIIRILWPYKVGIPGMYPKELLTKENVDIDHSGNPENTKDVRYQWLMLNICTNIQHRIDVNTRVNNQRTKWGHNALIALSSLPTSPVIAYLALKFLDWVNHHSSFSFPTCQ